MLLFLKIYGRGRGFPSAAKGSFPVILGIQGHTIVYAWVQVAVVLQYPDQQAAPRGDGGMGARVQI